MTPMTPTKFSASASTSAASAIAARMLDLLGVTRVRLMTNNPAKIEALRAAGLEVTDQRIQGRPTPQNIHYLATKRDRAGHFLDVDIPPSGAAESQNLFRLSLLLFVLASVYLAWPWLSGEVTIPWDSKAHFQPQLSFLAHALHDGQSPFWTPNVFAGMPQIADPQSLIFSPPFLLLAALVREPTFQQADAVSFLMLTLGGIGWMLYFRDRGWSAAGGLVAALAFAYGGSAAWRIQHTGQILSLSWFPLAFWALNRALDRASFPWGMLAGLFAAFMVLGRDQIAWLFVLTLTVFVIWRFFAPPEGDKYGYASRLRRPDRADWRRSHRRAGRRRAAAAMDRSAGAAIQSRRNHPRRGDARLVAPGLAADRPRRQSLRHSRPAVAILGPPSPDWGETGLYIARNMGEIYFGALPLMALLAFGVARGWIFDRPMRFFVAVAAVMAIYAFGKYTPVFAALFDVPGANLFRRPADATFPLCVFAGVIGGYCVSRALVAPPARLSAGAGRDRRALPVVPWRRFRQGAFVRRAAAARFFRGFRRPVAALARQGAAVARKAGAWRPAGRPVAEFRPVAQ